MVFIVFCNVLTSTTVSQLINMSVYTESNIECLVNTILPLDAELLTQDDMDSKFTALMTVHSLYF